MSTTVPTTSVPDATVPAADDQITYTQLTADDQLSIINPRIRQLESAYLSLAIRVQAPAPGDAVTTDEQTQLAELKASLDALHALAATITQS